MSAGPAAAPRGETRLGRLRRPRGSGGAAGSEAPVGTAERELLSRAAPGGEGEPRPSEAGRLERWVLVTHTFARARAPALLEGLRLREHRAACEILQTLATLSSSDRQARAAQQFGPVPEAAERLRRLTAELSTPLQAELLRRLPPYHRSLFAPGGAPRVEGAPPAMGALAERLIREATR